MQHKLAVVGAVAILALAAAVAIPAYALTTEDETPSVAIVVDATFPRVMGEVLVTLGDGSPAAGLSVSLASTYDAAPALPAATMQGFTDGSGVFAFGYQTASLAHLPGAHTLTATVVIDGVTYTASAPYSVP